MSAMPAPLPPSSPLLRRGRYEVAAYGPRFGENNRRLLVAGPFRYATEDAARACAEQIEVGHTVSIDRVAPINPRHPDGPWSARHVATIERTDTT